MNVSFHIGTWIVPILITIGIWVYTLNLKPQGGFIDISPLFYAAVAVFSTLVTWLIYLVYLLVNR